MASNSTHSSPFPPYTTADLHSFGLLPTVPRYLDSVLSSAKPPTSPLPLPSIPDTVLAQQILLYARAHLPPPVFNHSMRVFLYGTLLVSHHLASQNLTFAPESFLLLSLLHDLGTTLKSTVLSFEYAGGIAARSLLLSLSAPEPLADSVAEGIIRHQDVSFSPEDGGFLTALTAAVHLGTLFDNTGKWGNLLHHAEVEEVVKAWPRLEWTGCFTKVIADEGARKPWCHTTVIGLERFERDVEGNVMGRDIEEKERQGTA